MQVAARVSSKPTAARAGVRVAARPALRVVCQAQKTPVQKAAQFAAGLPALVAASPAFALVDDRLNGDGTGLPFGINDSALGFVIVGVFTVVWAIWYTAQKDLGDFEDTDSGLKL